MEPKKFKIFFEKKKKKKFREFPGDPVADSKPPINTGGLSSITWSGN